MGRLSALFNEAENLVATGATSGVVQAVSDAAEVIFASSNQSCREALLGCALARLINPSIDIRLPYAGHGATAFNGRTLDERVVNPFLKERQIPSSKGPYLAMFRRSVRFVHETGQGLRDQTAYAAMLQYLTFLEAATGQDIEALVRELCVRFVMLRDGSNVSLVRVIRMTLDQHTAMIRALLTERSGGRLPVFLTAAMLEAIRDCFDLRWTIDVQGINAADAASGAGGDIVVKDGRSGAVVMAIEVTERLIDRSRVISTFESKISTNRISEYLFLYTSVIPSEDARSSAFSYFAQGHDIIFLQLEGWLRNCLGTIGTRGRENFIELFLARLGSLEVPSRLKTAWNTLAKKLSGTDASALLVATAR